MATTQGRRAKVKAPGGDEQRVPVEDIVSKVGEKVNKLRLAEGLSLQQLSVKSDVSPAAIHKIERSSMVPTITTLLKLSAALGVPVGHFVEDDKPDPDPVHFTQGDSRPPVYTSHKGLSLDGITGSYGQFKTAAAVAHVVPGANSGRKQLRHPGEELVHVVSGEMLFHIGKQAYRLKTGDSLHFSGAMPHTWENPTKKVTELIWIVLRNGT